ncbi:uncharacterized protein Pyn_19046 [Prunus yedoensis var. nudiflora]|uniref:PGG domain-containing protein n=1 Tax=Prunus yedoensis var. nudiflora TaxID=2094558 RepID=A0A314XMD3_PRUYE|nr:uncharacterized protein Pyn_19046 [Prunus yedoensis var. nudiflora]
MTEKDLEITDGYGVSTFGCALYTGTIQMVRCLVEKNKQIVSKRLTSAKDMNMTPVLVAYKAGNWTMARYLYSVTPVESLIQEINGCCDGAELISRSFLTHEFDIAWDLIQHHPDLAITKDNSGRYPFNALASAQSCMCKAVKNKQLVQVPCLREAIFKAVERGHVEFIDLLGEANPDILRVTDGKGRNILQHAIESRQAKVYDFIYKHDNERKATVNSTDTCNNGILHAAGNLYPHLDRIKGAPLQMQSELQWFKEVESIAPANVRELTNYTDDMTAQQLFSKNHKELVKKGEKSLKATATSCTVAGTLIITMMFAASFTVPGGIRGDTGLPMFLKKPLFTVF